MPGANGVACSTRSGRGGVATGAGVVVVDAADVTDVDAVPDAGTTAGAGAVSGARGGVATGAVRHTLSRDRRPTDANFIRMNVGLRPILR